MRSATASAIVCCLLIGTACAGESAVPKTGRKKPSLPPKDERAQAVIDEVEQACRERTVYMIGPHKAARLAELVRKKKPKLIVECGTAVGYSGLWMARELKAIGNGKLITIEIDPRRAREAKQNFHKAGLAEFVEVKTGDARRLTSQLKGPVDFLFLDCNYGNYLPCFVGIEGELEEGAVIVADNVGIGAHSMADYLKAVRSHGDSRTEWFDLDLPWAKRDAMEITIFRRTRKK